MNTSHTLVLKTTLRGKTFPLHLLYTSASKVNKRATGTKAALQWKERNNLDLLES